jgi:predicted RNase H-like nuclease
MYGLDINKKYYISVDNWLELMVQETITIKDMNNIIKDLHLEKEVSLMNEDKKKCKDEDEDVEETRNLARNKWIQRQQFFDYCLQDFKKGRQWDTTTSSLVVKLTPQSSVKSVGQIIPTEIMDDSCDNSIRIKFLNRTQTAYETD